MCGRYKLPALKIATFLNKHINEEFTVKDLADKLSIQVTQVRKSVVFLNGSYPDIFNLEQRQERVAYFIIKSLRKMEIR